MEGKKLLLLHQINTGINVNFITYIKLRQFFFVTITNIFYLQNYFGLTVRTKNIHIFLHMLSFSNNLAGDLNSHI